MAVKKIVVFGASSKIAQEACRIWAEESCSFVLVGRNEVHLRQISDDLRCRGAVSVDIHQFSFENYAESSSLVENIFKRQGPIDLGFFTHGFLGDQKEAEESWAHAEKIIGVNFLSSSALLLAFANQFEKQKYGSLIVIGSVAGDRGRQSNYIYGTAKGALEIFSQGLRNRLFPHGVSVLLVKPGFVDTPMTSHLKKGFLFASASRVARDIVKAEKNNKSVIYTPCFWSGIMFIIRSIPEFLFKRLKL